jgi:HD-GYP domain-containing protein (c-di-GMP phosphodiesterase class II)
MKTEIQAVADAFKTVSEDASYRGRWIQDSDYAAIIRLEYGLQSDHLLSHDLLNTSLLRDR